MLAATLELPQRLMRLTWPDVSPGRFYEANDVLALALACKREFWSSGASRDAQKWSLDITDVSGLLVSAVKGNCFRGAEWCLQKPGGPWAACDVYVVVQRKWNEAAHKDMDKAFYLKCAISKAGSMLLSGSNHPTGS